MNKGQDSLFLDGKNKTNRWVLFLMANNYYATTWMHCWSNTIKGRGTWCIEYSTLALHLLASKHNSTFSSGCFSVSLHAHTQGKSPSTQLPRYVSLIFISPLYFASTRIAFMKLSIVSIFILLVVVVVSISMVDARRRVFESRRWLSPYEADDGYGFYRRGAFRCCNVFDTTCCCNLNGVQVRVNGGIPGGSDCNVCNLGWAC